MNEAQAKQAMNELNVSQIAGALPSPVGLGRQTAVGFLDIQIERLQERLRQRKYLRVLAETASEEQEMALLGLLYQEREWRV